MAATLMTAESFFITVLIVTAWTVFICLRTFAAEFGYEISRINLHLRADAIRERQRQKLQLLHESRAARRTATPRPRHGQPLANDERQAAEAVETGMNDEGEEAAHAMAA